MNRRPGILKFVVVATPVAVVFVFMTAFVWDYMRSSWFAGRAANIQIGDSKDQVLKIMGAPVATFSRSSILIDGRPMNPNQDEIWIYGPTFDFENAFFAEPPYFFPFRFRFGPYSDDVYFRFSEETGTVWHIEIPSEAK